MDSNTVIFKPPSILPTVKEQPDINLKKTLSIFVNKTRYENT